MAERPCVEIVFRSCPSVLIHLRTALRWLARECGFSEVDCGRITLCAVEATTNIIRHAYDGDPNRRIQLRLRPLRGGLELEFLDRGRCAEVRELRPSNGVAGLRPGGLGVRMMRACMDDFDYAARSTGGARLVLRKLLRRPPAKATVSRAKRKGRP